MVTNAGQRAGLKISSIPACAWPHAARRGAAARGAHRMIQRRSTCPKPSARCHRKPCWRGGACCEPSSVMGAKKALSLIPVTLRVSARIRSTCKPRNPGSGKPLLQTSFPARQSPRCGGPAAMERTLLYPPASLAVPHADTGARAGFACTPRHTQRSMITRDCPSRMRGAHVGLRLCRPGAPVDGVGQVLEQAPHVALALEEPA